MDNLHPCYACKERKTSEHFYKDASRSRGLKSKCKLCDHKIKNAWRKANYVHKLPKDPEERKRRRLTKLRISNARYEKNNIERRITQRLRGRLKKVMNHHIAHKTTLGKSIDWAGCSGPELLKHLESTWHNHTITGEPMTWDNYGHGYGKWTIDHKRPIIDYIRKGDDLKKANHVSNLQAKWYEDNIAKGDKLDF